MLERKVFKEMMTIRRLTVKECMESSLKHNNPNLRRLTDEEYAKLQEREPKVQKYMARQNALAERMKNA